jgi:hypothetical protein
LNIAVMPVKYVVGAEKLRFMPGEDNLYLLCEIKPVYQLKESARRSL